MKPVTIAFLSSLMTVALTLPVGAASLTGRISFQGVALSSARLGVTCPDSQQERRVVIGESGSYLVSRLPNETTCELRVLLGNQPSQFIPVNIGRGTKTFNGVVRMYKGKPVLIQR